MTALDELFMNDKERAENKLPKIFDIPLSEIDDFPDHPYRVLDDEDIQNVLGHVDISTTMNIYIDVTKDLKKEEMQNFANYVRSGNSKEPIINSI